MFLWWFVVQQLQNRRRQLWQKTAVNMELFRDFRTWFVNNSACKELSDSLIPNNIQTLMPIIIQDQKITIPQNKLMQRWKLHLATHSTSFQIQRSQWRVLCIWDIMEISLCTSKQICSNGFCLWKQFCQGTQTSSANSITVCILFWNWWSKNRAFHSSIFEDMISEIFATGNAAVYDCWCSIGPSSIVFTANFLRD